MVPFRQDPGDCPICGVAHSACTADRGPVVVVQLPARDALRLEAQSLEPPAELEPPIAPEETTFSTAHYRGQPKKKK